MAPSACRLHPCERPASPYRISWRADSLRRPTLNTGVRNRPNRVTPIMPANTVTPVAERTSAPAPCESRVVKKLKWLRAHHRVRSGSTAKAAYPAYAERWIRSVRQECLSKLTFLGERSLHQEAA
jgi:hypothetical protein